MSKKETVGLFCLGRRRDRDQAISWSFLLDYWTIIS